MIYSSLRFTTHRRTKNLIQDWKYQCLFFKKRKISSPSQAMDISGLHCCICPSCWTFILPRKRTRKLWVNQGARISKESFGPLNPCCEGQQKALVALQLLRRQYLCTALVKIGFLLAIGLEKVLGSIHPPGKHLMAFFALEIFCSSPIWSLQQLTFPSFP